MSCMENIMLIQLNNKIFRKFLRDFTLIEMLIVISIIMILCSMMTPLLMRAMAQGVLVSCQNNLRQIGMGAMTYSDNQNNMLPPPADLWGAPGEGVVWSPKFWQYCETSEYNCSNNCVGGHSQSTNIFQCPKTYKYFKNRFELSTTNSFTPNSTLCSYGLNSTLVVSSTASWTKPLKYTQIKKMTRAALINESSFYLGDFYGFWNYYGLLPHEYGENVLFGDGHSDYFSSESIPSVITNSFWTGK